MKPSILFFSLLFFQTLLFGQSVKSQTEDKPNDLQSSKKLIQRVLPDYQSQFIVEFIPASSGNDCFEIDNKNNKVVLRGNNPISIASALNYYLKEIANCNLSYGCGTQMNLPAKLLLPKNKIKIISPNKYRYAYNYCTHGYTAAWWNWEDWEKEIDYIAMQGINLALVIQGQEQILINTFKKFGYTDEEIRKWLVMPSHMPWFLMSNIEGKDTIPGSIVKKRLELGQKITTRMRELGIEPMLMAYCGMVPPTMHRKFPEANIISTGEWGKTKRPDMLNPTDNLFAKIAETFYKEQTELLGECKFFSGDIFHEGTEAKNINVVDIGKSIVSAMKKSNADAVWVLQAWEENPNDMMIRSINKSDLLILDLYCEREKSLEQWSKRNSFSGVPWLWCNVINFGSNSGLDGDLKLYATKFSSTWNNTSKGNLCGIGYMPEGIKTTPAIWNLFFEHMWSKDSINIHDWIKNYTFRRYGANSIPALNAWGKLLTINYGNFSNIQDQAPFNSVLQALPTLDTTKIRARMWAAIGNPFPLEKIFYVWENLLNAANDCNKSDGYRYDLVDITRQALSDAGNSLYKKIVIAYKNNNKQKVEELSKIMIDLFDDLDEILSTRQELLLGKWIKQSRTYGNSKAESDLCEYNARSLVTIWSESSIFHSDYSNRTWSGLVNNYYKHRWETFLTALNNDENFNEDSVKRTIINWELQWIKQTDGNFNSEPKGNSTEISKKLFIKWDHIVRQLGLLRS
jgi:alpha-N-acetylglucosaminidase